MRMVFECRAGEFRSISPARALVLLISLDKATGRSAALLRALSMPTKTSRAAGSRPHLMSLKNRPVAPVWAARPFVFEEGRDVCIGGAKRASLASVPAGIIHP